MTTTSPPPTLSSSSSSYSSAASDGPYAPLPDLWNSNASSSKHFPITTNSKGIFLPPLNLPSNSTSPTVSGATTPTGSYLRSSATPTPTATLFGGKESSIWSNPNPNPGPPNTGGPAPGPRPASGGMGRNPAAPLRGAHTTPGTPLDHHHHHHHSHHTHQLHGGNNVAAGGFFPAPIGSAAATPGQQHHGLGFNIPEAAPTTSYFANAASSTRLSYPPAADWPQPHHQVPLHQPQPHAPPPPHQQRGTPLTEENLYFATTTTTTTTPPLAPVPPPQMRKDAVDVNLAINAVQQLNLHAPAASPIGSPRPMEGGTTPTTTTLPSRESPKSAVSSPSSTTTSKGTGNGKKKTTTNTDLYKTELCASFMSSGGHCPYGEKCQFAHGEKELKVIDRPPKWRSKPCQNWVKNGSCSYNARCCFRHD
ncbi:hypothetical protein TRICI_005856 [Trichomonascus ciferrii]|uniref:C3H1-type domain-containing protein n=1 Tax=Trichomonascus ciferrii TaxID=44093 RepID=A0A642UNM5_9ASCO|nr:hypothetical protein TRICI_005856 [Trichomonascus ciferrii]